MSRDTEKAGGSAVQPHAVPERTPGYCPHLLLQYLLHIQVRPGTRYTQHLAHTYRMYSSSAYLLLYISMSAIDADATHAKFVILGVCREMYHFFSILTFERTASRLSEAHGAFVRPFVVCRLQFMIPQQQTVLS